MLDRLRIGIRDKRTVVITAKEGTPKATVKRIDRKLQVECGFTYTDWNMFAIVLAKTTPPSIIP